MDDDEGRGSDEKLRDWRFGGSLNAVHHAEAMRWLIELRCCESRHAALVLKMY